MKVRSLYALDKLQNEFTRLSLVSMNLAPASSGFPERAVSVRIEHLQKKVKEVKKWLENIIRIHCVRFEATECRFYFSSSLCW